MPETLSPLRYPGGKSKLAPLIKYIIEEKIDTNITTYIEPFAGGAGVALNLLIGGTVENIIINDYDKAVYSFWKAIITEPNRFVQTIEQTPVTVNEWKKQKEIYITQNKKYSFELGFATFFLNRTNRSGILSAGPIGGYNQYGNYSIDARFNKDNLIHKILQISKYRQNIKIYNKDVRSFISQVISHNQENAFVYFDPPYYVKGRELYINHFQKRDHIEIQKFISRYLNCPWVMTYDAEDTISSIYACYIQKYYNLNYSLANKGEFSELMIFSDPDICPCNFDLLKKGIKTILLEGNKVDNKACTYRTV